MACKYFHCANGYTVTDTSTSVALSFSTTVTAVNQDKFCFKLCTDLSSVNQTYVVNLVVNGGNIPLLDKYGNQATVSELAKGKKYCGFYGSSTPHVIAYNLPITYNCSCNNVV